MRQKVGEIVFPAEWLEGLSWEINEVVQVFVEKATGRRVVVVGGVLSDGTNLLGMVWRGGQNVCRCSPATRWAIEERTAASMSPVLRTVWGQIVDRQIQGLRKATAEWSGSRPE